MIELWAVTRDAVSDDWTEIEKEPGESWNFFVENQYIWVFQEKMSLEVTNNPVVFRLKSPNEMLSPRMKLKFPSLNEDF